MRSTTSRLAVLACSILGTMHGALPVSSAEAFRRIKPLKGISLDLGGKHAVAYYSVEKGDCRVVVTLADAVSVPANGTPGSTRVSMAVAPGSTSVVETEGGRSLNLTCAESASELSLE